jgi:hypothetical protein
MKPIALFLTTITISAAAQIAAGSITDHLIYEQASPTSLGDGASVYYSNPTNNQTMYDQFSFDNDTDLLGFGFWGAIYADQTITITIYEQDAQTGLLGSQAYQEHFITDQLNQEVTGQVLDNHWVVDETHAIAELGQSFTAQEDQTYWLSITGDAFFSWTFGAATGQNATLYSDTAQNTFWNPTDIGLDPTNLAFSIYGNPVPSPAGLTILSLFGIAASRRHRIC